MSCFSKLLSCLHRLRMRLQNFVIAHRRKVIQAITHVFLDHLLHPILTSLGVPELLIEFLITYIAIIVAHAIDNDGFPPTDCE